MALFVVVTAAGVGLAVVAGFGARPGALPFVVTLAAAALTGWAAAPPLRAAARHPDTSETGQPEAPSTYVATRAAGATAATQAADATAAKTTATAKAAAEATAEAAHAETPPKGPRSHRRPALASPLRTAVVAAAAILLAIVCWVQPGEPGHVLFRLAQAAVGLVVYALPLVPVLALAPAPPRPATPWVALWTSRQALSLAVACGRVARDALLGRAAGLVLVSVAMVHLLRGLPGLEESAYRLAGGLLGIVTAGPLAGLLTTAGAFGLLFAVLVGVAVATAGRLLRPLGRRAAVGVLVVLVVTPVAAAGVANRVGYRHFLGADGDRVVVIAGLSSHHRHETYDARVALADLPAPLRPVLRKGFPVADRKDGVRVAAALADPARATTDGFPDGGLTMRAGECFSFVGGTSNFRYPAPCNGEHTGEVFYVGRLPFATDPGPPARMAAARGACEKAYGGYLGAPYGVSHLPIEAPVVRDNLVACLFAAPGPWPLRGTRTLAALRQPVDWSPADGCTVDGKAENGLTVTAEKGALCVAPGPAVTAAGTGPFVVEAEFAPIGKTDGRVGVACLGADAATGYHATVGGDGTLTLTRRQGATETLLGSVGKAATRIQLTCRPAGTAVHLVAAAGKGRELTVTDPQGITTLGPRLVVRAAATPVAATVTVFTATLA